MPNISPLYKHNPAIRQMLDEGMNRKEIAAVLGVNYNTLKSHINSGYHLDDSLVAPQVTAPKIEVTAANHWKGRAPEPDVHGRYVAKHLPDAVLVIPDLQFPYAHPDALAFLSMVAQEYQVDAVVGIGDEIDNYHLSGYEKDPHYLAAERELEVAIEQCGQLFKLFPKAHALHSNHGRGRIEKARIRGGMLRQQVVDYVNLINAPQGWGFYDEVIMGDVVFTHGDGEKKLSKTFLTTDVPRDYGRHYSIVHGHRHEQHGRIADSILVGDEEYWAAYTGALINPRAGAFGYTKAKKARLGCLVILKGQPHRVPLRRDDIGRWIGRL